MTKVLHIDTLPSLPVPTGSFLAFDTNILIQLVDEQHDHHRNTVSVINEVHRLTRIKFVYFIASKLELQEYFRRQLLTRGIKKNLYKRHQIGGKGQADRYIDEWVEHHSHDERAALSDHEIKNLRELCLLDHPSDNRTGINIWQQLCQLCLGGLPKLEEKLIRWGIHYVNIMDPALYGENARKPQWEQQGKLMTTYGLGSADAAILNMAMSTDRIVGIVTNDGDMIELFKSGILPEHVKCFTFLKKHIERRVA